MEEAKQSQDLAGVQDLLAKWRHFAYTELRVPGSYFRVLVTAAHTLATGEPPAGSVSGKEIDELIRMRSGR